MTPAPVSRDWLRTQVEAYTAARTRYAAAADLLRTVLTTLCHTVATSAQVQARAKSVASFGEKALRSAAWARDPVRDFTDLCGVRVIVSTRGEVHAVAQLLRQTLPVEEGLGGDAGERLGRQAFGYRSLHLVLSLPPGAVAGVPVPAETVGLRAELQVRTVAEHAWADFAHDRTYKGQVPLPLAWERELSGVAASLESVDAAFARLDRQLRDFTAHYPAYLSVEEITRELADMSTLLALVPGESGLVRRVVGLAKTLGRWEHIVEVLEPYADNGPPDLVRDLGTALCQLHARDRQGAAFLRGRALLRQATEVEPTDADAWATLAGTYKGEDEHLSTKLYEIAYLAAPDDYYPLGNLLESPVLTADNTRLRRLLQPVLRAALRRCQRRADVGIDLPWSYLEQGRLHLLLEESDAALDAYCAAVILSPAAFPLETSRRSIDRLERLLAGHSGQTRARDLLTLALFARFGVEPDQMPAPGDRWEEGPLTVIAVGSSAADGEGASAILAALHDGTHQVICYGTGEAGHLPAELRRFSSLGPLLGTSEILQLYADVLRADDARADIAVLAAGPVGLDGPAVRLAVALGFRVGAVTHTPGGRIHVTWPGSHHVVPLPLDVDTLRAFLPAQHRRLPTEARERVARAAHEGYRRRRLRAASTDPAQVSWDELGEDYRDANRAQADSIEAMLATLGRRIVPSPTAGVGIVAGGELSEPELARLARMEHGRWCADRLSSGWRWAKEHNPVARTTPYLVPWADLPDDIRDYDWEFVRAIPALLAEVGLAIGPGRPPD